MSELTFTLLRLGYLALLVVFVLSAIGVLRRDMRGPKAAGTRARRKAAKQPRTAAPRLRQGAPSRPRRPGRDHRRGSR
ncbi:hypothetical protein GCM10025865_13930 [Paraoerskovia sediminicola]|uniref:Uncharacterized protein n=1 Tax=Paraoerskovia sediminicola TaxID=1138587 RepID=A0ABN6XB68_9CELL|nr:hypothetical protein [Paraoerskovia sediminicola]BDZ42094.1 hypothetical protein GCM10025865_13930 [Paraoerskovia sediminicola]